MDGCMQSSLSSPLTHSSTHPPTPLHTQQEAAGGGGGGGASSSSSSSHPHGGGGIGIQGGGGGGRFSNKLSWRDMIFGADGKVKAVYADRGNTAASQGGGL